MENHEWFNREQFAVDVHFITAHTTMTQTTSTQPPYNHLTQVGCLPFCHPGFESQEHHLFFFQCIFELCHVEKTKINEKEARSGPLKNYFDTIWLNIVQQKYFLFIHLLDGTKNRESFWMSFFVDDFWLARSVVRLFVILSDKKQ